MIFDGLCHIFRALSTKRILGKVEGRQRPDGGNVISRKVGSGLYSGLRYVYNGHLLALWESSCNVFGTFSIKKIRADVQARHRPLGGVITAISVIRAMPQYQ